MACSLRLNDSNKRRVLEAIVLIITE